MIKNSTIYIILSKRAEIIKGKLSLLDEPVIYLTTIKIYNGNITLNQKNKTRATL